MRNYNGCIEEGNGKRGGAVGAGGYRIIIGNVFDDQFSPKSVKFSLFCNDLSLTALFKTYDRKVDFTLTSKIQDLSHLISIQARFKNL
jgi:hypothetical protein